MEFLWGILLLSTIGYSVADCPKGSIYFVDRQECIQLVKTKSDFNTAKSICQKLNGSLIQPSDIFENVMAGQETYRDLGDNDDPYIGVIKGSDGTSKYADGTPLIYQNWQSGHPQSNVSCATMSSYSYQWTSVSCDSTNDLICSIPADTGHGCPDGECEYYKGQCYYFWNPHLEDMSKNVTQSEANAACQSMGASLVSIHSNDENAWLQEHIDTSFLDDINCDTDQVAIGLTCNINNTTYHWLDGSPVNYKQTRLCTPTFGLLSDVRCLIAVSWDGWDENHRFVRYIRKKAPTH